jgi:predicted nucleic acid-binding protein
LSVYFDASVIVPMFLPDVFNARNSAYVATGPLDVIVSDFVSAEFVSVVGIRVRTGSSALAHGHEAIRKFDEWARDYSTSVDTEPSDVRAAQTMLRRLDLVLRAPDAINLAIAQRLGAELATFDIRMADCARALGISVVAL